MISSNNWWYHHVIGDISIWWIQKVKRHAIITLTYNGTKLLHYTSSPPWWDQGTQVNVCIQAKACCTYPAKFVWPSSQSVTIKHCSKTYSLELTRSTAEQWYQCMFLWTLSNFSTLKASYITLVCPTTTMLIVYSFRFLFF